MKNLKDITQNFEFEKEFLNGLDPMHEDCNNSLRSTVKSSHLNEILQKIEAEKYIGLNPILTHIHKNYKNVKIYDDNTLVFTAESKLAGFGGGGGGNYRDTSGLKKGNRVVSEKSVKKAISNLFLLSEFKNFKNTYYRCNLITLTARHNNPKKDFQKRIWSAWRQFYIYLKKKFPKLLYVLAKETHRSGYVHLHILTNLPFLPIKNLNEKWLRCLAGVKLQGYGGSVDLKIINEKKGIRAAKRYVAKYLTKNNQSEDISGFSSTYSKKLAKDLKLKLNELQLSDFFAIQNQIKTIIEFETDFLQEKIVIIKLKDIKKIKRFKQWLNDHKKFLELKNKI